MTRVPRSAGRIARTFARLKKERRNALSLFLTAGFPSAEATRRLVPALESAGADIFEIGFPFSDPIADGPVLQAASEAALRSGMTWEKLMGLARDIRRTSQAPLLFMGYANTLYRRGWKASARSLARAGFDGAVIPDLIPEMDDGISRIFRKEGLALVYLCAPTSSPDRLRMIAKRSTGFIYCVSVAGVTGARRRLPESHILGFLKKVRSVSRLPVLLGFGISNPGQLRRFGAAADGVIIGSALANVLASGGRSGRSGRSPSLIRRAKKFIMTFSRANRAWGGDGFEKN